MKEFLEYIMANYTWFLGGAIIILLAVIGSYADKTNFGQGNSNEEDKSEDEITLNTFNDLQKEKSEKLVDTNNQESNVGNPTNEEKINNKNDLDNMLNGASYNGIDSNETSLGKKEEIGNSLDENSESKNDFIDTEAQTFNSFEEEFNHIIPEKEVIDGDLLEEIEDLSLDKTKKIDLSGIPDLDDLELPKIKDLKSEDEDIWKF